jgi:hypothetical protein
MSNIPDNSICRLLILSIRSRYIEDFNPINRLYLRLGYNSSKMEVCIYKTVNNYQLVII